LQSRSSGDDAEQAYYLPAGVAAAGSCVTNLGLHSAIAWWRPVADGFNHLTGSDEEADAAPVDGKISPFGTPKGE